MKHTLERADRKVIYERHLPSGLGALVALRHEVTECLQAHGVAPSRIEDAVLVVSELGTNAMHAAGYGEEVLARIAIERGVDIVVEVEDPGAGFRLSDGLRIPSRDEEHGRGLSIVCLLAHETTVRRRRRRTVVQARICGG